MFESQIANPSVEEIREMCGRIQRSWSPREERARRSGRWGDKNDSNAVVRWTIPRVKSPRLDA